jgi:hypothetical protein
MAHHPIACTTRGLQFIMERVVLVGFLPESYGCHCVLHPFGCGNALVLNQNDMGGLHLRLRSFVQNELACYTMNADGSDGCGVYFTARDYAVGVMTADWMAPSSRLWMSPPRTTRIALIFHRNHGYVSEVVLCYGS